MEPYSVFDVANYFITLINEEEGDLLSNLKLQKLCYYAQGIASVVRDAPLFYEDIQAWEHGPVVPPLYRKYKEKKASVISEVDDDFYIGKIHPADRELLNDVYKTYGQFSAWKLRDMTHQEAPWINANSSGINTVITWDALKDYFIDEVTESYIEAYGRQVREEIEGISF